MKIVFATHNKNKLKQVKSILKEYEVVGLDEMGIEEDIEEKGNSFRENAEIKASFVHNKTGEITLADDSGLCIDVFEGWPGVETHRFLGENATDDERNDYILTRLKGISNRSCSVICSLCLIDKSGKKYFKEGVFDSTIATEKMGDNKFSFDQIVIYKDNKTLAQATEKEKLKVNARSLALTKILNLLQDINLQEKHQMIKDLLKRI